MIAGNYEDFGNCNKKNNPRSRVVFEINGQKFYTISGKLFEAIKEGKFEESK
jgi:hypothetical protein